MIDCSRACAISVCAMTLAGCGVVVPEIQENRFSPVDGQLMVQAIIQSVHCEAIKALKHLREKDIEFAQIDHRAPASDFLLKWGVQLTLTLTIEEKSTVSPTALWTPHTALSSLFTLGGGVSGSADATRTDKMSFYYLVKDLIARPYCATGVQQGNEVSLLVQSDLKLEEWLADYLTPLGTKEGQAPTSSGGILKSTVLTHDVKFEVLTSGNINPSWKLINVTYDPTGSLFATSRDRTHDLIFTLGPGDKTGFTSQAAFVADQSQQIGNAVAAAQRAQIPAAPRIFPIIP
jgi:hypothetical protein